MKKEINYLIFYFATVIYATIIAISLESKENRMVSIKVAKSEVKEPNTDWTNVSNPQKKAYLEHLYNTSDGQEETKKD